MTDQQLFTLWQEVIQSIKNDFIAQKISNAEYDLLLRVANQSYEIERNNLHNKK